MGADAETYRALRRAAARGAGGEDRRLVPRAPRAECFTTGKPQKAPTGASAFAKPKRQELVRALALALWWGDWTMSSRTE